MTSPAAPEPASPETTGPDADPRVEDAGSVVVEVEPDEGDEGDEGDEFAEAPSRLR